jgi:uncharacterized Zn finger protein
MKKHTEDVCPNCGCDDNTGFEYNIPEVMMSESVSQDVQCSECRTIWTQVYKITFSKIVNIRK